MSAVADKSAGNVVGYRSQPIWLRNRCQQGRRKAVASILGQLNLLAEDENLTAAVLRDVVADPKAHPNRQAAALRLLRMREAPDMADYEPVLDGTMTLNELRKSGVSTEAVRKVKVRRTTTKAGDSVVEREIELYGRSGAEFDRLMDRTVGKPTQAVSVLTSTPQSIQFVPPELPGLPPLLPLLG